MKCVFRVSMQSYLELELIQVENDPITILVVHDTTAHIFSTKAKTIFCDSLNRHQVTSWRIKQ